MIDEQTCRKARQAQASRCEIFEEIKDDELEVAQQQLAKAQQTISAQSAQIAEFRRQLKNAKATIRRRDGKVAELLEENSDLAKEVGDLHHQLLEKLIECSRLTGEIGLVEATLATERRWIELFQRQVHTANQQIAKLQKENPASSR